MHTHKRQEEKGKIISHKWHRKDFHTIEGWFFKINGWLWNTPDRLLTLPESIQKRRNKKRSTVYIQGPQIE